MRGITKSLGAIKMVVYDKAKWHEETVLEEKLPVEHATHHIICFLRWLMENDMMSENFKNDFAKMVAENPSKEADGYEIFERWDNCFVDEMLSEEGNQFTAKYFDLEKGHYIKDYETLAVNLPTIYHVEYTESNYGHLERMIDTRYAEMKKPRRTLWPFGKKN